MLYFLIAEVTAKY